MIFRHLSICLLMLFLTTPALAQNDPLSVDLYGRLWPKLTYIVKAGDESRTDVTDAISRLGTHQDILFWKPHPSGQVRKETSALQR